MVWLSGRCSVDCLKGIIEEMARGYMRVRLSPTGHRFWCKATPTSRICRAVLIAWDYVHDKPCDVFTEDDLNIRLGGGECGAEFFSVPYDSAGLEVGNYSISDNVIVPPLDFWWREEGVDVSEL